MKKRTATVLKGLGIAIIALIIIGTAWHYIASVENVRKGLSFVNSWGIYAMLIFFGSYVLLATVSFPTTPLNISAGMLFNFWPAVGIALAAASSAAIITFLFSRYMAQEWVKKRIEKVPNVPAILEAVEEEGFKMVLFARLNPFIPATIKNHGFAITNVSIKRYAAGTVLGQIPIIMLHVYLGWVGGLAMLEGDEQPDSTRWLIIGSGIIVSIVLVGIFAYYGKRKIDQRKPQYATK